MRKIIVSLAFLAVLLAWALPSFAGPFTDVPTDHWAYDAIDKLQAEGFVEGYPDGTFRGNRSFTRYEMAMVVARIWDRIVSELENLPLDDLATQADIQNLLNMIDDLRNEFRDELDALGMRVDDLENRMSNVEGRLAALESGLGQIRISGTLRTRIEDIITNEYPTPNPPFEAEQLVNLSFDAMPSDFLDVHVDLLQIASYLDSPVGDDFAPNQALVIDEAWAKADMMKLMGWNPTDLFNRFKITVGRQYARFGEFGLAFDNGYETRPGIHIDLGGDNINLRAFLARNDRMGVLDKLGVVRASYTFGESTNTVCGMGPSDPFATVGFNYLATGIGWEQGMGADIDTQLLSEVYLNRLRVEYFMLTRDQNGYDVADNYGDDFESNLVAMVDLYNNGNTRVSAMYADIGLMPGFSSVDNDPFNEYDALAIGGIGGTHYNYAYESGINPFHYNYVAIGGQIEHTWWDVLHTTLTFFDGTNQAEEDLPAIIRLNVRYPLSDASDIALEYIHSGIDALSLAKLRGEFLVRF